jgi:hypothetical protein
MSPTDKEGWHSMTTPKNEEQDEAIADLRRRVEVMEQIIFPKPEEPETPAPPVYPKVASVFQEPGESWAQAVVRNLGYGFNGAVRYMDHENPTAWDDDLQELAQIANLGEPFYLQLTAKAHDGVGLVEVLENLPEQWKPGFIYNFWQEPEDNLLTPESQETYRNVYTEAAMLIRDFNKRTGSSVQLPWVEWQEWTVNPNNHEGWDLANFVPPAEDFGGVLWSMFEFNQKDRIEDQVNNIIHGMATYAPGKPWGLMACGAPTPLVATDQQKQSQAAVDSVCPECDGTGSACGHGASCGTCLCQPQWRPCVLD